MTTKSELSTGFTVEEFEIGVDTEDVTVEGPAISDLAEAWERLADVYSAGELCPACMWHESGWNPYTQTRWRECGCFDPSACPGVNDRSIPAYLRRQAE